MKQEDWKKLDEVLDKVADLPPGERAGILDSAGLDPAVRRALEKQLEDETGGALGGGLDAMAGALVHEAASMLPSSDRDSAPTLELGEPERGELEHRPGDLVGAYRLGPELGSGGMGRVFLADRVDGQYEQQVAIKLVRGDEASWGVEQRFRRERQILAALEHPHVARLLDGGLSQRGVPYFVMELVDGRSISRYCAEEKLDLNARIRLFLQVCEAVAHAHRNLIVHRDLKPGNIMVSADGQVKLLDFGIAKILSPEGEDSDTQMLGRVLTPRFAAPEQLVGDPITTATDVFGLGLVLAELLVGPAIVSKRGDTVAEALRWQQSEPPSLSGSLAVFSERDSVAEKTGLTVRALRRALRGDLDAIVGKALMSAPEERYETAAALKNDLARYQQGLPVVASRGHLTYRARLFVRRHRAGLVAAGAILLTLVGGWFTTARQARRAALERDRAQDAEERALALNRYLIDDVLGLARPEESGGADLTLRELLHVASRRAEISLASDAQLDGAIRGAIGETYLSLGDLAEAEIQLTRSLERLREGDEPSSPQIWQARRLLARLKGEQGAASVAVGELEMLVRELEVEGAPEGEILLTRILLGEMLADAGDRTRAERVLREVLRKVDDAAEGDAILEPGLRRQAMFGLATTLQAQRRSSDAAEIGNRLLLRQEGELGPKHPEVVDTLQLLADASARMEKNAEATRLQQRVVDLRTEILGEDHPKTISSVLGLARLVRRQGDRDRALQIYAPAAERAREALGTSSITISAINGLGVLLRDLGDVEGAIERYEDALQMSLDLVGEEAPGTVRIMKNLVRAYHLTGERKKEVEISRRVIDIGLRSARSNEPDWTTLQDLVDFILVRAPSEVRDLELAEELALRAVELSDRQAPEALAELADVYRKTGRLDEAIDALGEALRLPDSLYLYSMERDMMLMLEQRDGLAVTEGFLRNHLERRLNARGPESPLVATSRWLLGRNLMLQGQLDPATELLRSSLEFLERFYAEGDDRVVRSRAYLAVAEHRQGKNDALEVLVSSCRQLLEDTRSLPWTQQEVCALATQALTERGDAERARRLRSRFPRFDQW